VIWILPPAYLGLLLVGGALKLSAGLGLLLAGTGPIGAGRLGRCAAAVLALTLVEWTGTVLMGANVFAAIMLAWINLALIVPLCGAAVLVLGRGRATGFLRMVSWSALGIVPLAAWASLIEPGRLQVERPRLALPAEREGSGPLRIGVLADLQTTRVGDYERTAVERLMALAPDVILVPGDLFQGPFSEWPRARDGLKQLMARLSAPGGVFVVSGNCDYKPGLPGILEGSQAQLLVNRAVSTVVGDRRLRVLGLEDGAFNRRVVANFEAEARADPGAIHVVLVHRPGAGVEALSLDSPVDLVVGGHTHGGQVALPFWGPPLTLSSLPRSMAAGGLHPVRGSHVYVSRGVGLERKWAPRVRFLCPPEVTLLTLE
jgi:uncharacterized protein